MFSDRVEWKGLASATWIADDEDSQFQLSRDEVEFSKEGPLAHIRSIVVKSTE